ncbi:hypothetical protein BZG36_03732 [Bifiguratus adelaidae]|uniref:P-loop containing nucleoside triphosphate hydrolase protein n=1 Tax=Bifiguratus adelaidae TaxID=1938954 RepID=A0A261XZ32_9FUNG|nr:hypothetical protein BZG36_03732 [Bifiguratus adelaidae]
MSDSHDSFTVALPSLDMPIRPPHTRQTLILLVGLPGSGKSTFANSLVAAWPHTYTRINQDDLGSRQVCEDTVQHVLSTSSACPVIDRCNFDHRQRKTWIELARHFSVPVDALVMMADERTCRDRIMARTDHPTNVGGVGGVEVLERFVESYKPPRWMGRYNAASEGIQRLGRVWPVEGEWTPDQLIKVMHGLRWTEDANLSGRGRQNILQGRHHPSAQGMREYSSSSTSVQSGVSWAQMAGKRPNEL